MSTNTNAYRPDFNLRDKDLYNHDFVWFQVEAIHFASTGANDPAPMLIPVPASEFPSVANLRSTNRMERHAAYSIMASIHEDLLVKFHKATNGDFVGIGWDVDIHVVWFHAGNLRRFRKFAAHRPANMKVKPHEVGTPAQLQKEHAWRELCEGRKQAFEGPLTKWEPVGTWRFSEELGRDVWIKPVRVGDRVVTVEVIPVPQDEQPKKPAKKAHNHGKKGRSRK